MASHPLTHHEILGLVEPFARRGRHVDLAMSNRLERRLAFKPIEHAGETPVATGMRETLQLENSHGDTFRLTRVLTLACGVQASLQTEGPDPGELLARIESIAPQRQFRSGAGFVIAASHRLEPIAGTSSAGAPATRMILTRGIAQLDGLTLVMSLLDVRGTPADIELKSTAGDIMNLPEDLLSVLGWDWARLTRMSTGWTSIVRLRRSEPERSADAERKLERTALHLARTLAEPPGHFHDRLIRARWRVFFRRAFPLLASIGLIAGTAALPRGDLGEGSVIRMLLFHSPPLLLVMFFCMRELPRIEIPPLPRRSAASTWREPQASQSGAPQPQELRSS